MQRVRVQVGELRAASYGERRERAAALLDGLALALASTPQAKNAEAQRVCDVTREADALSSDERKPFQESARIKRALTIVVELLEEHAERADSARIDPWLGAARRAVQSIDERGMMGFQGPEIQDAFRTTVDALTVLAQAARAAS